MASTGYVQIGIPIEMYDEIKALIDERKELGFKTIPEFVKDATRLRMLEIRKLKGE